MPKTKTNKTEKSKGGRPKIKIDYELVKQLCKIQCTGEEIASALKINYDTLNARIKDEFNESFSDYYKRESADGKISLRRAQFKAALNGNVTMQIWLGKQLLGQKEPDRDEPTDTNRLKTITVEYITPDES